ncbi:MAG: DUF5067 domain-containing protein [Clostridia bacterium]|nr:DUF5067 domain-containing protein [Clostridia bacterium]
MKCVQCGNEFDGNVCPKCGYNAVAPQSDQASQQPTSPVGNQQMPYQYQNQPVQPQKKKMAWWKIAIGVLVFLVILGACFGNGSSDEKNTAVSGNDKTSESDVNVNNTEKQTDKTETSSKDNENNKDEGVLGDYKVKILSYKLAKDYEKKPAIVVTFEFTNNSDDATSFIVALNSQAYQDGIELETAIIMDSKVYNSSNSMKDIKPGKTIKVQTAYVLDNKKSDVEIEVSELFSFSDDKVVKTFKLK